MKKGDTVCTLRTQKSVKHLIEIGKYQTAFITGVVKIEKKDGTGYTNITICMDDTDRWIFDIKTVKYCRMVLTEKIVKSFQISDMSYYFTLLRD